MLFWSWLLDKRKDFLDQSQISELFIWADKVFCVLLAELGALRGHTLQPTTKSVYSIAKGTIFDYVLAASRLRVLRVWEAYEKIVETNGHRLSNEFKGHILFDTLIFWNSPGEESDDYCKLILSLLTIGADTSDTARGWCWYQYPMEENLCAFEIFLLTLVGCNCAVYGDRIPFPWQKNVAIITEMLEQMLSHEPNLENTIVYATRTELLSATAPASLHHLPTTVSFDIFCSRQSLINLCRSPGRLLLHHY